LFTYENDLAVGKHDRETRDPETCICAAVVASDGQVIRCHRHADGLRALEARKLELSRCENSQGFITSRNRYVNRQIGFELQKAADIPSKYPTGYCGTERLMSEDLY